MADMFQLVPKWLVNSQCGSSAFDRSRSSPNPTPPACNHHTCVYANVCRNHWELTFFVRDTESICHVMLINGGLQRYE